MSKSGSNMYGRRLHSFSHASPAVNLRFTGLAFRCQKTQYFDSLRPSLAEGLKVFMNLYLRRRKLGTSGVKPRLGCC